MNHDYDFIHLNDRQIMMIKTRLTFLLGLLYCGFSMDKTCIKG